MAYAIAHVDEQCHCGRPAERIVGTQSLCGDHFANLIEACRVNARARITTPKDITPDGFAAWAILLRHGVNIGLIADDEAAKAWDTARDFAA
jgi:hypothetical protein